MKRHKNGIKIFKLCNPTGYVGAFIVYDGKGTMEHEESLNNEEQFIF